MVWLCNFFYRSMQFVMVFINKMYFFCFFFSEAKQLCFIPTSKSSSSKKYNLPIVTIETKPSFSAAMHTNRDLVFIPGQRGKNLLLYQNYTYSKNNGTGSTIYWKCRTIQNGKPCNARITTFLRPNGLYNVCLTKPEHTHPPSLRLSKNLNPKWKNYN